MTKEDRNGESRGSNWIPMRLLSMFGISQNTSRRSFDIFRRAFREDFPLWIGSVWILWKQQQPQKSIGMASDKSLASTMNSTTIDHGSDSTQRNNTLNFLIDAAVLGILLVYKKSCEEKFRQLNDFRDDKKGSEEKNRMTSKSTKSNKELAKTEEDSIDELRGLLKKHSVDSSQLLAPKMRRAMGIFDSEMKPVKRQQPSLGTIESSPTVSSDKNNNPKRYLELLVHNVSHTDLILNLDAPFIASPSATSSSDNGGDGIDSYCLCRPRFSAFDAYSQKLADFLKNDKRQNILKSIIKLPRYERNDETQQPEPSSKKTGEDIPIGIRLDNENEQRNKEQPNDADHPLFVSSADLKDLRVRGRDAQRAINYSSSSSGDSLKINAVFFPLLATLMPLWMSKLDEKYKNFSSSTPTPIMKPKKVLILVSGVGQPRNWTHSIKGNSTQQCAELMKIFLQTIYPELVIVHIHSDTNIFRYDENINFVQNELLPRIQEYRDAHAKGLPYPDEVSTPPLSRGSNERNRPFSTEWRKSFSITLSFADGSPARNHAIQAALRTFKPMYYHFWQLKTFWHESKIVESDIEVHSFEEMETLPPVETNQLYGRPLVKKVVDEMKRFRDDFCQILSNASEGSDDIRSFWLRKSKYCVGSKHRGLSDYVETNHNEL